MLRTKIIALTFTLVAAQFAIMADQAEAGPLLDWLRGRRCQRAQRALARCNTCPTPQTVGYAPNAAGLQPGQCMTTCEQTCSRVVVNYVPYTAYRTCYKRVPVTTYRPVTTSDPCTGCTVTCMKPCTTYTYQQQRVPYTTYRPVYRTETYKVPVSYITNDCATGACATGACETCPTCPTGVATPGCPTCNVAPSMTTAPSGTLSTGGTYNPVPATSTPTPADIPPSLDSVNPQTQQRPAYDRIEIEGSSTRYQPAAPAIPSNYTSQPSTATPEPSTSPQHLDIMASNDPVRRRWTYSPVHLASYTSTSGGEATVESPVEPVLQTVRGNWNESPAENSAPVSAERKTNSVWKTINW